MEKIIMLIKNNKKVFISCIAVLSVFIIILASLSDKGSLAVVTSDDSLIITCPETANVGSEISCSITLNVTSMSVQGFSAGYKVSEGLEFVSFTPGGSNWRDYSIDGEGLVLVDFNGWTGEKLVGTVKYKIPSSARSDDKFKVELINIEVGDGVDKTITINNVYDEVRILSNVNTLKNITLTPGSLDGTFNPNANEINGTVNSDKVNISVEKTDPNSSVSGDTGQKTLHYGTNTFSITVTAGNGSKRTYTLKIKRPYELNTTKYVYNKNENYIYTKTDVDSATILENLSIPSELTSVINNGKLVISYSSEELLNLDVLNTKINSYTLNNGKLYVTSGLFFDNFASNIILGEHMDIKVFNGNEEINGESMITNNMTLKVYYRNEEIDSYFIAIYNIDFDNSITVDNNYIKYLPVGMKVKELLNKVATSNGSIYVYDKNGNKKDNDALLASGDILRSYLGNELVTKYQLSVLCDVNGDGRFSTIDIAQFRKHYVEWVDPQTGELFKITGVYEKALDINKDGKINITDLGMMRKLLVGVI